MVLASLPCRGRRKTRPRASGIWRWVRRCEGPHWLPRKRPRTLASAMQSVAAVGLSRNLLSRDFWRHSIFDFCNNIGAKRSFAAQTNCRPKVCLGRSRTVGSTFGSSANSDPVDGESTGSACRSRGRGSEATGDGASGHPRSLTRTSNPVWDSEFRRSGCARLEPDSWNCRYTHRNAHGWAGFVRVVP